MSQTSVAQVFPAAASRVLAEHPGDESGRMLRSAGLRTGGKFYGFATADDVVLKLPEARVRELVSTGEGVPCAPRAGRPMREWVRVVPAGVEECVAYLLEARAFVAAGGR